MHPSLRGTVHAGNWVPLATRPSDASISDAVLFAFRDSTFAIGGYEERITTYGCGNTDFLNRFAHYLTAKTNYFNRLLCISHVHRLSRAFTQKNNIQTVNPLERHYFATIKNQCSRFLLMRYGLPIWSQDSEHIRWVVSIAPKKAAHTYKTFPTSEVFHRAGLVFS